MNIPTIALVNKVATMTKAIVNNNTCPSVMTEVPHKFAVIKSFTYSLMLCCFPTLCLWKILVCKSFKGIVHAHHQYQR